MNALSDIAVYLENPPTTTVIIEIDPKTAREVLEKRNKGNRPPKANKVNQFSGDMSSDRWGLTGDTIKFGTDGRLLDGQNRLAACIKSGKNFKTHVIFGIDPALFGRMDIGKPRNPADILHIAGYKYASTLAAAIRWAHLLDNDPYDRSTLQPDEVLRLAKEKYNDIEPYLKYGRDINRQFAHPAGQLAALIYHFSRSDNKKAMDFIRAWLKGDRNGKYQIIDTMQALLHSQKANNNGRIHELTRASIIIKAWNIFKLGQKGSLAQLQSAANTKLEIIS
ncbi:hypothetical protein [Ancylobacter amanitiformis]|uniref:ParB/Sulfiredoxin domain-containing protein n=1 Tax=Ancylobacter amanitiformis TaxID=217069 RepID=A0ABU0LUZ9_9HYPH|nr:hypothetical protein [Ancylobacter amanitiformis]MDQ0512562.1 hypothetical protein [Ancylobacter amanitiformis]